jgi:serine/threonine protein kinase
MSLEEIPSDQVGKIAYRRDRYGSDGRFKVLDLIAGAGQGYALLTEDTWCGGLAVLKGLWWEQGLFRDESWQAGLDRSKARQQQGLKAVYQAVQLTQQAPAVIDVLAEPSPTLEATGIATQDDEYFVITEFVGERGRPVRTLENDIKARYAEGRPFTEDELIDLAEQLCGALAALHARRPVKRRAAGRREEYWIHADVKPENVLVLGPPALYVLIDYDAAVVDGQPIGTTTLAYSPPAPPGAARGPELDAASERFDIYMLGATLAEALGLTRLDDDTRRQLYGTVHEHGQAKRRLAELGHSPILTTLIASCLAEPSYRTRNVQSIQADLSRARESAVLSSVLLGNQ